MSTAISVIPAVSATSAPPPQRTDGIHQADCALDRNPNRTIVNYDAVLGTLVEITFDGVPPFNISQTLRPMGVCLNVVQDWPNSTYIWNVTSTPVSAALNLTDDRYPVGGSVIFSANNNVTVHSSGNYTIVTAEEAASPSYNPVTTIQLSAPSGQTTQPADPTPSSPTTSASASATGAGIPETNVSKKRILGGLLLVSSALFALL